jgi:hypothetical protein
MFSKEFPRKADSEELEILYRILPDYKPGYKKYRELIKEYYFISKGRSEESLILSRDKDAVYSPFVMPVFAAGSFIYNGKLVDVVINEEIDETIEIEIDIKENITEIVKDIIYPEWIPGMRAPGDETEVREIIVIPGEYTLAIAAGHKRLWLYDHNSGVNYFLNPGAFYGNLCMIKNIRAPGIVLNPKLLFNNLANYSDNELISAFYLYNKSLKKFRIEMPAVKEQLQKPGFFKSFLKKDKN